MAAKLGADTKPPKAKKPRQAPKPEPGSVSAAGQGHNSQALKEERQRLLYREGDKISQAEKSLADLKEQMKPFKTTIAQARAAIQKAGFPLAAYDERIAAAKRLRSDNVAFEVARNEITEAFALPTADEIRNLFDGNAAAQEGMDWEAAGFTARLTGADPKPPVTGTDGQLWLKGWHEANKKAGPSLAEAAADAIQADELPEGEVVQAPPVVGDDGAKFDWGTVGARGEVVVLNLKAFDILPAEGEEPIAYMDLDECCKNTVRPEVLPYWDAAGRVLVFHEGKRRILKADDYEDTGAADVDPSPIEDAEEAPGQDTQNVGSDEDPADDEAMGFQ